MGNEETLRLQQYSVFVLVQVLLVCLLQDIRLTEHSWSMALLYVAPL